MPVRQGALRVVRRQVASQPLLLRRPRRHVDARIEHHHVPRSHVIAVVALPRIAGGGAEVLPVTRGAGREVLVTPHGRPGARLMPAPRRSVAAVEVGGGGAGAEYVVAEGEDGAGDRVEQGGSGFVVLCIAARDVTRADDRGTGDAEGLENRPGGVLRVFGAGRGGE